MGRGRLAAVPLFDYIEKTFGLMPINCADRLQISRALYSKWRSGAHHLRGWKLILIKDRFNLDWDILIRLVSLQYPKSVIDELLSAYADPEKGIRPAEKRRRKATKKRLREVLD